MNEYVELLKAMIETPSLSGKEDGTAALLEGFLAGKGVAVSRLYDNLWAFNRWYDASKPTVLLCSHHDTVPPNGGYTRDPFKAIVEGDKLYGLGSNDAGASLVSLAALFLHFFEKKDMRFNLCLALVGEEEVVGGKGIVTILPEIGPVGFALVGEPTKMEMAVAERGLMVLDCIARGRSGHAAHGNTVNPIYIAMKDIEWFSAYKFEKVSPMLDEVRMSVTVINAGERHNVVPAECRFVVDIRMNECYTHEEVLEVVRENIVSETTARSTNLRPSSIDLAHPIVKAAEGMGIALYGSATMSDQARIPYPSVKMGVGDSLRSHTADEFVHISEIESGIGRYIELFEKIL